MNPADFNEHSPGRLVPVSERMHAFIPAALPEMVSLDDKTSAVSG
jgi:hypothetical protein